MPLEGEVKQQELNRNPFLCTRNGASLQVALSPVTAFPQLLPTTWHPPPLHRAWVLALSLKLFLHLPRRVGCRPTHQLSRYAVCHQSPEFKPHGSNSAETLPHAEGHDASSLAQLAGSRGAWGMVLPLQKKRWLLWQLVSGAAISVSSLCNFNFNNHPW